ncbi:MAG TPA: IreB family regulatory phosphoprotein [Firmicutes bacterium]|nr:IreB family regulatory phosphoprotein [Bacillota bacterium]HHY97969.1 IreB family regulatory phosphoprotein [Bacillota bacterium]
MKDIHEETQTFKVVSEEAASIRAALQQVYLALREKGYNPVNQLVGYLLSGDPTYITSHRNARNLIRKIDRDEILEELVRSYLAPFTREE